MFLNNSKLKSCQVIILHWSEHCVLERTLLPVWSWHPAQRACHRSAYTHPAPHSKVARAQFFLFLSLSELTSFDFYLLFLFTSELTSFDSTLKCFLFQSGRPRQALEQKSWWFEKSHLLCKGIFKFCDKNTFNFKNIFKCTFTLHSLTIKNIYNSGLRSC